MLHPPHESAGQRAVIAPRAAALILVSAAGPKLTFEDLAPRLAVGAWVQGELVASFQTGQAWLVELWATWPGPCKTAIPPISPRGSMAVALDDKQRE